MRLRLTHLFEQDTAGVTFPAGCPLSGESGTDPARCLPSTAMSRVEARSMLMRFSATVLAAGLLVALTSACTHHPPVEQAVTVTTKAPPTATPVPPDPRVGAVFLGGGTLHTCTAGVLHSAAGDLILTAAHCVAEGVDAAFVAGLNNTAAPDDVWHIDAVYLDPRWVQNQDPLADFAIARVSRAAGGTVE